MNKILLIDDSQTIRDELKAILADVSGIETIEAENGLVGLEQLEKNPDTNLMIVDVNMPEMDGLTMIGRIHEEQKHTGIPIVMLTTETSKDMKDRAKELGIRAWILKPCDEKKIMFVIDKLLNQ